MLSATKKIEKLIKGYEVRKAELETLLNSYKEEIQSLRADNIDYDNYDYAVARTNRDVCSGKIMLIIQMISDLEDIKNSL